MVTNSADAALAIQCRVAHPPNTPVPKTYNFCLSSGESERLKFAKGTDIDSIRVLKTDGRLECSELQSDLGIFVFDKSSSSLLMGPTLETGCYLVLWNEV